MKVSRFSFALLACLGTTALLAGPARGSLILGNYTGELRLSASYSNSAGKPQVLISGEIAGGQKRFRRACRQTRTLTIAQTPGAMTYPGVTALAEKEVAGDLTSRKGKFSFKLDLKQFDMQDPQSMDIHGDVDDGGGTLTYTAKVTGDFRGVKNELLPVRCRPLAPAPVSVTIPPGTG